MTEKLQTATNKFVEKSKKAINKGEENLKKEDLKRKDGIVLI